MGPRSRRFWFPLVRLGAFLGAVVVVGNVLFLTAYSPVEAETVSEKSVDFLSRSKRRIERKLRVFERFFFGPRDSAEQDSGALRVADPAFEVLQESDLIADAKIVPTGMPVSMASTVPAPEVLPFVWPTLPERPSRLPIELSSMEVSPPPESFALFYRAGAGSVLEDCANSFLRLPEALIDEVLQCIGALFPRPLMMSSRDEPSITERIFEYQTGPRQGPILSEFLHNWVEREQRFVAKFGDSELDTPGVQDGTEEVDLDALRREQGKVLWDVVKKTYLSKYKFKGEDRIREDAFYFSQWRGADFAVVPTLLAGYVWFRGIEKRVSMGDTWARFTVEPLSRWVSGKEDLYAGVSVEWGIKGFPLALIVSAGRYDGKSELDFIGIGTSVGMARKALAVQRGD